MHSAPRAGQRGFCALSKAVLVTASVLFAGSSAAEAAFPSIGLVPVSQNEIVAPVGLVYAGDGSNRLFSVDQRGKIQIIQNGALLPTPFLDIGPDLVSARAGFDERGLLGLAFHPDYAVPNQAGTGKFYVYYSGPVETVSATSDHFDVLAEYTVSANPNVANPLSKRILLTNNHPQFNHDGGQLAFGPDRQLYMSIGDGGGGGDDDPGHTGNNTNVNGSPSPINGFLGNAQDKTKIMGKILRIDPLGNNSSNGQYGIPADNPIVGAGGGVREEIWAYGLRNTWRFSFDDGPGGTGRLFAADVGQGSFEEINIITKGGNYGWRIREGLHPFDPTVSPTTPGDVLIDPINEYDHSLGLSVTGGYVYRGSAFPELQGKYIYGDWSKTFSPGQGTLLGLEETSPGVWERTVLDISNMSNPLNGLYITAFGEDEMGNLYVVTRSNLGTEQGAGPPGGMIFMIVPEPGTASLAALAVGATLLGRRRGRATV